MGHASRREQADVKAVRRAAARQLLELVLIIDVTTKSSPALANANVTRMDGAFHPSRKIAATSIGRAVLVDVRNGYVYGTAEANEDVTGLGSSFWSDRREVALREEAIKATSKPLFPEILTMLQGIAERAKK